MLVLDLGGVLSVLLAVTLILMFPIIIGTYIYRRAMLAFYYVRLKHNVQIDRNTYRCFHNALIGFNSFYGGLRQNAKAIFIKRIAMFLETKTFHGRNGVQITEEIKVRIAGACVQLTYGMDRFAITYFTDIMVYPKSIYSKLFRKKMLGATSPKGFIMLSLPAFQKGFEVDDDRINPGLHEMAHALRIQDQRGEIFDQHFSAHLSSWDQVATKEMRSIKSGKESVLRNYARVNIQECFAVTIEHFFERPRELNKYHPALYTATVHLLRINPLNTQGDFRYP